MFCSIIIPTIGREALTRAVTSILDQNFKPDQFEVIVVNDTGQPLPPAAWQQSERVQVIVTNRHERCVARNTGAAVARGQYLHFLDDDDWLLPGAHEAFWTLAQAAPEADWLYGGAQLVDREGQPIIELHHNMTGNIFIKVMSGEWIPLQTSLIKTDAFFAIGGFHPLILVSEDVDLVRRIALRGDLAETERLVACIGMGEAGSSTDYERLTTYSRQAREQIFDTPGLWSRLRDSAHNSYWHGRLVRVFLTSAVWNMQHRRLFTAVSRTVFGLGSLVGAGRHAVTADFWRALSKPYASPSFQRGFEQLEQVNP